MSETNKSAPSAWLTPIAGPPMRPIELVPGGAGLVIGRSDQCDIRLPVEAENVSRRHARLVCAMDRWRVSDLSSRWGTFVNGQQLAAGVDVILAEGDLIRITPWTFCFSASKKPVRGLEAIDDSHATQTIVRSAIGGPGGQAPQLAGDLLSLLIESAAGIHAASDERSLAELVLDAACRGTGLSNAALLRPLDNHGRIEVVASRVGGSAKPQAAGAPGGPGAIYSRSLIAAASGGEVAEFFQDDSGDVAQSIVQMQVNAALCVPLMMGSTVAAYLYLDSRGSQGGGSGGSGGVGRAGWASASAFCVALGRMAGLALANLKRVEMEKRQASMMAELSAGGEAQRWILPRRRGTFAPFSYTGESRPGRYVGGDFFDVIPLSNGRLAVAIGDVTGKGIPASVLMTATQGFLHASLKEHGQPERAVNDLNQFICPRRPENRFVTLWVGIFDSVKETLCFVDAGHGYGLLARADGSLELLSSEDGLPVGVAPDVPYESRTVPLSPGWGAMIVSDGIIEQPGAGDAEAARREFGLKGLKACVSQHRTAEDIVAALFAAVVAHAGTDSLADDATAVWLSR